MTYPSADTRDVVIEAARALLRVDDLHLDNRDEKAALRDALIDHRNSLPEYRGAFENYEGESHDRRR
jgi:hypothetical protein